MAGKQFKLSIMVDATTKGATKSLGALGKTLGGVATAAGVVGTAVVGGAALAGGALLKLAVDAAPLQGIEDAFKGIAEASGEEADALLEHLQKGSAGMIKQRDLMQKYNLAAQLVSDTFANQLPSAMRYLSKVAAGTGEDMGYMLDSLVRGVGRLSPMILDNLGIQVDLTAANEIYAETLGKSAAELTKTEQQTALMNQVMEKLAENTANMPDVAGTAAQGLATLGTRFADLKDIAGQALLPALSDLLQILLTAADKVIPYVELAFDGLAEAVALFTGLGKDTYDTLDALSEIGQLFGFDYAQIEGFFVGIKDALDGLIGDVETGVQGGWPGIAAQLAEWGRRFWDWIKETVVPAAAEKLQDIAIAIQAWAESEGTQSQLAQFGETAGAGLVAGFTELVSAVETWSPILAGAGEALASAVSAAAPMLLGIGVDMGKGILSGLKSALTDPTTLKELFKFLVFPWAQTPFNPLPGFQFGGTMPGPKGQAGLAVLHGGETVTSAGRAGRSEALLSSILAGINALVAKESIIVVETSDGGATRDHILSLGDRAWALPAGA